jgi:hypothetical protein
MVFRGLPRACWEFSLRLAGQTDDLYQGNQEVDLNTLFTALNNWGPKIVFGF